MAIVVVGRHLNINYGDTATYIKQARLRRFVWGLSVRSGRGATPESPARLCLRRLACNSMGRTEETNHLVSALPLDHSSR